MDSPITGLEPEFSGAELENTRMVSLREEEECDCPEEYRWIALVDCDLQ